MFAQVAQPITKRAVFRVKYVSDNTVYIDAGRSADLQEGMKSGKFTIQLKMPSNYAVPAHWHPTDEKVTLVSGKLAYGMSDRLDKANAEALAEGASVVMKATS